MRRRGGCQWVPAGASGCQRVPLEGGSQTGSCELAVGCKAASNCTVSVILKKSIPKKIDLGYNFNLGIGGPLLTLECPRLWRITKNSLHIEGTYM